MSEGRKRKDLGIYFREKERKRALMFLRWVYRSVLFQNKKKLSQRE